MGFLSKLFGKKTEAAETKVGGVEDFSNLLAVYFQAILASELNITNLAKLPELRMFKTTLHIPTQGGRLGVAEKERCKNIAKGMYDLDDNFFKELDSSVRRNCKTQQDIQSFGLQFQNFMQEMMMVAINIMGVKARIPNMFKKILRQASADAVSDIYHKNDFSKPDVIKSVLAVREYNKRLGFSQKWSTDFVYAMLTLVKKEKRPQIDEK